MLITGASPGSQQQQFILVPRGKTLDALTWDMLVARWKPDRLPGSREYWRSV